MLKQSVFAVFFFTVAGLGVAIAQDVQPAALAAPATPRPARIDPANVKLYVEPPAVYEVIGPLEVSSRRPFSRDQTNINRAVAAMKERAARMGANGVILGESGTRQRRGGMVSNGVFIPFRAEGVASGVAIYVPPEPLPPPAAPTGSTNSHPVELAQETKR